MLARTTSSDAAVHLKPILQTPLLYLRLGTVRQCSQQEYPPSLQFTDSYTIQQVPDEPVPNKWQGQVGCSNSKKHVQKSSSSTQAVIACAPLPSKLQFQQGQTSDGKKDLDDISYPTTQI